MSTIVITGPTGGIGREVAVALAAAGHRIGLAARSPSRAEQMLEEVAAAGGSAFVVEVDLASLDSVAAAARRIRNDGDVDVLVNNAGEVRRGLTAEGYELIFGVDYLAHFLLTTLLTRGDTGPARVVNVSSDAHYAANGIDFAGLERKTRSLTGIREYQQSKLAMVMHTIELAARDPGVTSLAVHPGVVATGIWRPIPPPFRQLVMRGMVPPAQGAIPVLRAIGSDDLPSGTYLRPSGPARPSQAALDPEARRRLWDMSLEMVGPFLD
jgi:NAD(P)-dependent dehydrogenase (short-subunit alcohol dehydrogenase family)